MISKPAETITADRKEKLRWYQYRLRSLLIFTTLFAVFCSWFAVKMKQAEQQREAVEQIVQHKGSVGYDGNDPMIESNPPGPEWLHKLLGVDFFMTVTSVELSNELDMKRLGAFPKLRSLRGDSVGISDAHMPFLAVLSELESLIFENAQISDSGLENLAGLSRLRFVSFVDSKITDARAICALPNVEQLDLAATKITDDGLKYLSLLTHLKILDLADTNITDETLKHLQGATQLEELHLSGTKVTDAGLKSLHTLPQLHTLTLVDTDITDHGLKNLQEIKQLKYLDLNNTKITDDGLKYLEMLPFLETLMLGNRNSYSLGLESCDQLIGRGFSREYGPHAPYPPDITERGLANLKGSAKLHTLEFHDVAIAPEGFDALKEIAQLKKLTIWQSGDERHPKLTDKDLRHIAGATQLRELDISDSDITDEGLTYLKDFSLLQELNVVDTKTTPAGERNLQNKLPNLQFTQSLFK